VVQQQHLQKQQLLHQQQRLEELQQWQLISVLVAWTMDKGALRCKVSSLDALV
jgi:hypothetical protein